MKIKERIMKMSKMEKVLSGVVIGLVAFLGLCYYLGGQEEMDTVTNDETIIREEQTEDQYVEEQQEPIETPQEDVYDNALATDAFVENYIRESMAGYSVTFDRNGDLVFITISAPDVDASQMPQALIDEAVETYGLSNSAELLATNVEKCYSDSGKDVYCTVVLYDVNGIELYRTK